MLLFQRSHCVLHAFGGYQGTLKEVEGCYKFNACIMFYMLSGDPPVPEEGRGMPLIPRLYYVLHALRRYQGTLKEAEEWY